MKTVNVKINLYSFDGLSEKAKVNAIEKHRDFELSVMRTEDFISGDSEHDTPEELQKTYDSEYDYYLMNDEPIIENIEANEYLFFGNGELADCVTYCGAHPKTGITEFKFMNSVYQL